MRAAGRAALVLLAGLGSAAKAQPDETLHRRRTVGGWRIEAYFRECEASPAAAAAEYEAIANYGREQPSQ